MSIQIQPNIQIDSTCPYCHQSLKSDGLLWYGMHTCLKTHCHDCDTNFLEGLVDFAINFPYKIDLTKGICLGGKQGNGRTWLSEPLLYSLQHPESKKIEISREVFKSSSQVILLNCIDFLYGHCLLKLLNASRHLAQDSEYGLVVIVQPFLRWLVPDGVAEIWTVNIPLRQGSAYYPAFEQFVREQIQRFDRVLLSEAYLHPSQFDITQFTRIPRHDLNQPDYRITFIWREDRTWFNLILTRLFRKLKLPLLTLRFQNWRIRQLFNLLRSEIPDAKFTVAGLGTATHFPGWIEDCRVARFDEITERETCKVYAESRLVIGVHGSNMLLPSAHAGMTIDLMPDGKEGRWGNFAEDILYQEPDSRLAAYRYRYISFETGIKELGSIAHSMLQNYSSFYSRMVEKSR